MKRKILTWCCSLLLAISLASAASADAPTGWAIAGNNPAAYDFGTDSSVVASGSRRSAYIKAKASAVSGFGVLMQTIAADNYQGSRLRLSALLRTGNANRAQMWMRVDGADRKVLAFDNMDARPVSGTTDWQRYEIVLDVPKDSVDIAFGFFLMGGGSVWADQFQMDQVGDSIPTTAAMQAPPKSRSPVNLDFSQ